ncbi:MULTISPECIES: hypothetical protein [Burkholderia]|uniref:Uncharacterized protein n=2 Tax=Burkholderiaceae TaxID=119060 RepID=A0A892IJ70_9BURK|nr:MULTISPECIES: hypothetical protein [Burkholderia]AKE01992.1 hypothetical protein XM57_02885 [Burkholderia cepacia]ETP61803.1 hypothetical protein BDSB_29090 [Burkholderia dolosa PC543]PRE51038.1 hypothetical protein C6P87_11170 [Burkholderia sp. AU12872]AYZ95584.1 hypothetical protein EGY28_10255 [Burkholderia dolosa]MBY4806539.1 hypothetical protein [Burkholderia dolosa]
MRQDLAMRLLQKNAEQYVEYLLSARSIDLNALVRDKQELHLMSCYSGGSDGLAQRLADVLQIPVIGYVDADIQCMQDPLDKMLGNAKTVVGRLGSAGDKAAEPTRYEPRPHASGVNG